MKNVAMICFKYPPVYSGYGKQLKIVNEELINNHKDVKLTILTAYTDSVVEKKENINIISLLGEKGEDHKTIYPFSFRVLIWLVLNKNSFDFIHCIKAGPEAVFAYFGSIMVNKKLIIKITQQELSDLEIESVKGLRKINRLIRQKIIKKANIFIAISSEIENMLKIKTKKNSLILNIPNGVDTSKYNVPSAETKMKFRKELLIQDNEVVLLFAGAVNKRKGIFDLLTALSLYDNEVKLKLIVCGPILEELDFFEKIELLNNSNKFLNIEYRGLVENVDQYMKATDIFVLPSYSEGLPNVMLEAGATGLPLIGTNIGGINDIVLDNTNGYIIDKGDYKDLNEKITSLVNNKELREKMGRFSREIIDTNFSLKKVSNEYHNLYESILKKE